MISRIGIYHKELTVVRERIVKAVSQKDALKQILEDLEQRRAKQLYYLQQRGLL